MSLRMIEIFLHGTGGEPVEGVLADQPVIGLWHREISDDSSVVQVLLRAEETDSILDLLEGHFGQSGGFRAVLLPVEASCSCWP